MRDTESETIIEIETPEIDAEAIMRRIRENLRSRREEAEARGLDVNSLVGGEGSGRFSPALYRSIRQVSVSASRMGVSLSVSDEGGVPILSSLARPFRALFHQLVVFYVNQLAMQQNHQNRQLVRVLKELMQELEREGHLEQLQKLEDEIEALRGEVARLTAQAATPEE